MSSPPRLWLLTLMLLFELSAMTSAGAAQYVIEGFSLGERAFDNPAYRSYSCKPSDDFAGLTWCQRTKQRSATNSVLSSTIMHNTGNGTAVYLMANVAPITISRKIIQSEIDELSREINQRPAMVKLLPERQGLPTSLVALWGEIKLEELKSEAIAIVAAGNSPKVGVLVDTLGDLQRSAKEGLPVYRITGGPGYLYSASFDRNGHGHRHYVAANASQLLPAEASRADTPPEVSEFELEMEETLKKDQSLAADDYRLWPKVAEITRRLARKTSPKVANDALDKVFAKFASKKLYSHVWSILPGGAIDHLADHEYWKLDILGPNTGFPALRRSIQSFLAGNPPDPFTEFLYYVLGDYDRALQVNPNSIINDVLHYAIGHRTFESLLQDTAKTLKVSREDIAKHCWREPTSVQCILTFLNEVPQLYADKPLGSFVPSFSALAASAKPHFEKVLRTASSRSHADDAAYILGWLALHQGKTEEALSYFAQSMVVGNGDYSGIRRTVRILERNPPDKQLGMVKSNHIFAQEPALWYVAARSAYRDYNYGLAIESAELALKMMNVPLERLPATTDPKRIEAALEKIKPQFRYDRNMSEIPYLIEASREILQHDKYLSLVATERPDIVEKRARAIILKYSMLLDQDQHKRSAPPRDDSLVPAHKDLRQAVHLIDRTLERTPNNARYSALREWLYYRKARILAVFAPQAISEAIAAMEQEFPKARLLPNALAEELYAEGVMRDLSAAQRTFRKLVDKYPTSNAIDNAYTWMAIIFRCEGRVEDAQKMNREIIRRFPLTRHAVYAQERMAKPSAEGCGLHEQ
jgi:tetratricopeptide (TPR) repeat protein